jgi:hypothetical protein
MRFVIVATRDNTAAVLRCAHTLELGSETPVRA